MGYTPSDHAPVYTYQGPRLSLLAVEESDIQRTYESDAKVLGELGRVLASLPLAQIQVRLPKALAEQAVTAWNREENSGPLGPETCEQRLQRHRAGTLGLIGLTIAERGKWTSAEVVVHLDPVFIGLAVDAADDLPS